jgi:putative flippase GtrA
MQQLLDVSFVGWAQFSSTLAKLGCSCSAIYSEAIIATRSLVRITPRHSHQEKGVMQFVRYLLVQVLAYGLDMGGFVLLFVHFGVAPLIANIVGKILAGVFAFVVHRHFTFEVAETGTRRQQGVRYFALLALNIPLSALVLDVVLRVIPDVVAAKFVADMISVVFTYWLSKRIVFVGGDSKKNNLDGGRRV